MNKNLKNKSEAKTEGEELRKEAPFSAESFTEEISLLLSDYFRGNFVFDGKAVTCSFENGQKFILKAEEIK